MTKQEQKKTITKNNKT